MKKMMSMILALVLVLSMSGIASAEIFVEAITEDIVTPAFEETYEEPTYDEPTYDEPTNDDTNNAAQNEQQSSEQTMPTIAAEEIIPMPMAEVFEDEQVPLGNGLSLVVEIVAANAPVYGEDVTLKSFVVNPTGAQLSYEWQYDNGLGWTAIENATESNFTFNYNELVSNYEFRVVVDYAAA